MRVENLMRKLEIMEIKRYAVSLLAVIVSLTMSIAQSLSIELKSPGRLEKEVGGDIYKLESIKISGAMDAKDLECLRKMAGVNYDGKQTEGRLKFADLRDVCFLPGDEFFSSTGGTKITDEYILPVRAFSNCQLETVILPTELKEIGAEAFWGSSIKEITLPENIVIKENAFMDCKQLAQINFPQTTKEILYSAFYGCESLRQIVLNDVCVISGNAFLGLPVVESICIRGDLGHIDGWNTFADCPELTTVEFDGVVLSTGGPRMFANCPNLTTVIFKAPIIGINIGKPEGCPLLRDYKVQSAVYYSMYDDLIRKSTGEMWLANTVETYDMAVRVRRTSLKFLNMNLSDVIKNIIKRQCGQLLYEIAVNLAKSGKTDDAKEFLKVTAQMDYIYFDKTSDDETIMKPLRDDVRYNYLLNDEGLDESDYYQVLKLSPAYETGSVIGEPFIYQNSNDKDLVRVREYFKLDSIMGNGDEISRIKNIMSWVHNNVRHDGASPWPDCNYNSIDMYNLCKNQKRGLNARFLNMMLNEMYLACGFKSRFIVCMPKNFATDKDCEIVTIVWSETLGKWIMMDPSYEAYVTDGNGLLLHPGEIRQRIIDGLPVRVNDDANWNNKVSLTQEMYFDYKMKNFYLFSAHTISEYNAEGNGSQYSPIITLVPVGVKFEKNAATVTDDAYFWQSPL